MKNQDVMTRWGDLRRRQLTFSHGRNKNHDGLHRGQQHRILLSRVRLWQVSAVVARVP